jgi:hypothetical protein
MASRFGGVAGVIAIVAALVIALTLHIARGGAVDYAEGTYTFAVPATDYSEAKTVLVQDGVVTDVWISEAEAANQSFGYTPQTPAIAFESEDESSTVTQERGSVRQCWFVGTSDEHCTEFTDIEPLSAARAHQVSAWSGLADGTADLVSRSVTWEGGHTTRVSVQNGVIIDIEPHDGLINDLDTSSLESTGVWVRYRLDGEADPFAICFDSRNASDEEVCYQWGTTAN